MTHGFRRSHEPPKKVPHDREHPKTGSKESDQLTDTPWDAVDPAEFFDPEEFGYRRREPQSPA